ncbi:MAG: cupin domain-containing protein [Nannocystis sp.]|nr:cupin domain-containing protein [Nannocystis sp.]
MNLHATYVHLRDDRSGATLELTPTFWQELTSDQRPELDPGRLVMVFSFTEDWPTWERHPAGDEVVVLLAGEATLILEAERGEQPHHLGRPGDFVLVPQGAWHTARITRPCTLLFITPGEGTENRPIA